ncbi:MAG: response regulator [Anaerolineales bacterium]|nr:response regulator [Anaerolineales bacterium]
MPDTHVLYIEDNADNRLLVKRVLEAAGYQVSLAAEAESGLAEAMRLKPQVILIDINLPEVDGYTLTARLRATAGLETTCIIALTANVMKGDRERTLLAGCNGYIQKPIDVDAFPAQVAHYLAQHTHKI